MSGARIEELVEDVGERFIGPYTESEEGIRLIGEMLEVMSVVEPEGVDKDRSLWVWAERGEADECWTYEPDWDGSRGEFESHSRSRHPWETVWFRLLTKESKKFNAVLVFGKSVICHTWGPKGSNNDGIPVANGRSEELMRLLIPLARCSAALVAEGTYDSYIEEHLPKRHRIGFLKRRDWYKLRPKARDDFRKGLTDDEIDEFGDLLGKPFPKDTPPITAELYISTFCKCLKALGRKSRFASDRENYAFATKPYGDRLLEIASDDPKAFEEWIMHGHPDHAVDLSWDAKLYVNFLHEDGWRFFISGLDVPYEMVRAYLAVRRLGLPAECYCGEEILKALREEDRVYICPCHAFCFGPERIEDELLLSGAWCLDFTDEELEEYAEWLPLELS